MLSTHLQPLSKILYHSGTLFSWDLPDLKGKFTQKNMLFSDVRFDKIGKNAVDCFSISPLVLKIFAFKVEKLVISCSHLDMQMKVI